MGCLGKRGRVVVSVAAGLLGLLLLPAGGGAHVLPGAGEGLTLPALPTNDLQNLLSLTGYPTPTPVPVQQNPEPPLEPAPRAECGPGSRPLAGWQGRVPASAIDSPEAERGWTCNVTEVSHYGAMPGGFRVWRYVDRSGHTCAFYDTSLSTPLSVVSLAAGPSPGVAVLDMADPAHPVQTATLTDLVMLAPHESLNLNAKRGLLAADMGNGLSLPGLMSIYDVGADCRHPVMQASLPAARFGHESGFAPDGKTFWIAGGEGIAAVDVSDPQHPRTLWEGNVFAHGLNLSDDGRTLYDSDPIDGKLTLLDVSQVQDRFPQPQVHEISSLRWNTVSVPQNTIPVTIGGHRYLIEFDEFAFRFNPVTVDDQVGAARIIDIADPAHPRVVSNLRLEVNQRAVHQAADGDPSLLPAPAFNYAAHYCAVPREVDPGIVACSFINSGLRVFNVEDPLHPREVAYFVSPPKSGTLLGLGAADMAMSQPAFDVARHDVWYTDASSGFYALHLDNGAWPEDGAAPASGVGGANAAGPKHRKKQRCRKQRRHRRAHEARKQKRCKHKRR